MKRINRPVASASTAAPTRFQSIWQRQPQSGRWRRRVVIEAVEPRILFAFDAAGKIFGATSGSDSVGATVFQLAATQSLTPSFTWSVAQDYGKKDGNGLIELPNTLPSGYGLELDASSTTGASSSASYNWSVTGENPAKTYPSATGETAMVPNLPVNPETNSATYSVTLTVNDGGQSVSTTQTVTLRDVLIVQLGDSYGSGEGNPDSPISNGLQWADGVTAKMTAQNLEAHRSSAAASSQAALLLEQDNPQIAVTYLNLAESGATIPSGLVGGEPGIVHPSYHLPSQINELKKIVGKRHIDFLFLSVGGNDLGFTKIIADCLLDRPIDKIQAQVVNPGLVRLTRRYNSLAHSLKKDFSVGDTLITAYPDMTRDQTGQPVAFAADVAEVKPLNISLAEIDQAHATFISNNIFASLNNLIATSAARNDWTDIDGFLPDFLTHGYPSNDPWFWTNTAATGNEGPDLHNPYDTSDGAFHPTGSANTPGGQQFGLNDIADNMLDEMENDPGA